MRKLVIMMIMGVALMALPTMAQQQEWKSTSAMQTSGSAYTPQVTEVGATAVTDNATTTENYSPAKGPNRAKRDFEGNTELGPGNPGSPLGDAVLPLLLCAFAFCGVVYLRRKRAIQH